MLQQMENRTKLITHPTPQKIFSISSFCHTVLLRRTIWSLQHKGLPQEQSIHARFKPSIQVKSKVPRGCLSLYPKKWRTANGPRRQIHPSSSGEVPSCPPKCPSRSAEKRQDRPMGRPTFTRADIPRIKSQLYHHFLALSPCQVMGPLEPQF